MLDEELNSPSSSSSTSSTMTMTTMALDEVWRLVDKYYTDCTFNDQYWDAARVKYAPQNKNNYDDNTVDDATSMRAANEMIKYLGDKYTCLLDRDSYAAIQRFTIKGVVATLMTDSQKKVLW